MSFRTNGWENSNDCNFFSDLHNNPSTFFKSSGLYQMEVMKLYSYLFVNFGSFLRNLFAVQHPNHLVESKRVIIKLRKHKVTRL